MVIPCATLIHLGWAFLILFWNDLIGATPLALLTATARSWLALEAVLLSSVLFACISVFCSSSLIKLICLLPQQTIIGMSFISSLMAVITQQYADGVPRHFAFILADQLPILAGAVFHTYRVLRVSTSHEQGMDYGQPLPIAPPPP